jgi:murein DD-endopeptidase MepM/ murein hydrolase activator NlpD
MSKTPEESIADLRKSRDEFRQQLEALQKKPVLPDDLMPLLAEINPNDPAEAVRAAIQASRDAAVLKQTLEQKEIALQEYDITKSSTWQEQFVTPISQARQSVITALADARIDPSTGRPVVRNQAFVDAAMDALVSANTDDPVTVKAVLTEQAAKLNLPTPELSTINAVASSLKQLSGILARGEQIKKTWVATKSQREADEIRKRQEAEKAATDALLSEFDVHVSNLKIPGIDPSSVTASAATAKSLFQDVTKKTDVAAVALAKAALFDQLINPYLKWRADNKMEELKVAAQTAPPASPAPFVLGQQQSTPVPVEWNPPLATVKPN